MNVTIQSVPIVVSIQNSAPIIVNVSDVSVPGGVIVASFNSVVDFGKGGTVAYATISDPTMTASKVIQPFFTQALDEVAVLNMRVSERSRIIGTGFSLIAVAPTGAFGTYTVRVTTQGA
jgi:hypothetical protein